MAWMHAAQPGRNRRHPAPMVRLVDNLVADLFGTIVLMTMSAPARAAADLSYLLSHASHVLATRMAAATAEIGLTPGSSACCSTRSKRNGPRSNWPRSLDLDKTTMVVTVDDLERAGLAKRPAVECGPPGPDHRGHPGGWSGPSPRGRRSSTACTATSSTRSRKNSARCWWTRSRDWSRGTCPPPWSRRGRCAGRGRRSRSTTDHP